MGYRKVEYIHHTDEDFPDAVLDPGENLIVTYVTGPFITGTWAASTPAAPTDTYSVNGPAARVFASAGGLCVFPTTGEILGELLINGVVANSAAITFPGYPFITYGIGVFNADSPIQGAVSSGATVQFRITNNTDGVITVAENEAEETFRTYAEEFFPDEPITEEELCPDVYVTQNIDELSGQVDVYDSSAVLLDELDTIGEPIDLSFRLNEEDFVVIEHTIIIEDTWQSFSNYCLGSLIVADGKVFKAINVECGSSGEFEPSWPGSGTVVDADVTWEFVEVYDPVVFLEEFDANVSTGVWGPVLPFDPNDGLAVKVDSRDNKVYVLGWVGSDLKLVRIATDGSSILDTWNVSHNTGDTERGLCIDIGTDDCAYYTINGSADGSGNTEVFKFNIVTEIQEASPIILPAIFSNPQVIGPFKLLLGTSQGGIVLVHQVWSVDGFLYNALEVYNGCWTSIGFTPVDSGGNPEEQLCWGESSNIMWVATDSNIKKIDISTFTGIGLNIPYINAYHHISSCTAKLGIGPNCVEFFFPIVTLIGAN